MATDVPTEAHMRFGPMIGPVFGKVGYARRLLRLAVPLLFAVQTLLPQSSVEKKLSGSFDIRPLHSNAVPASVIIGFLLAIGGEEPFVSVLDLNSGAPISGVVISVSKNGETALEVETDSVGHAKLPGLQPGAYSLRVEKPGYLDLLDPHGRGHRWVLSSRSTVPMSITMTRAVAISGQVTDREGKPVRGEKVIAVVRRQEHGELRLTPLGEAVLTDDGGRYRLHGLPPGHYSVAVVPTGEDMGSEVFAPVFFPGTADPGNIMFLGLEPGQTRTSVDLTLSGDETLSISGTVSGIPKEGNKERPAVSLAMRGGLRLPMATVLTEANGTFVIRNVPPGQYQLTAWWPIGDWDSDSGPVAGAGARSAVRAIAVSGGADVRVDLELVELVKVEGRLIWNGKTASDSLCKGADRVAIRPEDGWLDGWSPSVSMTGDGFTVAGLPAGRYRVELPDLEAPCRLAAVRVGKEVAPEGIAMIDGSAPITLVISTASGEVSGVVTNQEAKPARGVVVLVPEDGGERLVRIARLDAEGRYRFDEVPVGTHRLIAMDELNSMDYLDPLAAVNQDAILVLVEAGRKASANLRLSRQ